MNALERGILRSLRDCLVGDRRLEKRVVTLEGKVDALEKERHDYAPPELLARLEALRARLQAIR